MLSASDAVLGVEVQLESLPDGEEPCEEAWPVVDYFLFFLECLMRPVASENGERYTPSKVMLHHWYSSKLTRVDARRHVAHTSLEWLGLTFLNIGLLPLSHLACAAATRYRRASL